MDKVLSKYWCGFQKGFGAKHCLFAKWGKWKREVDNSQALEAQVVDLLKALGCLPHKLLIAKLNKLNIDLD